MFHTVLVANRGEIACRVIETLRRLGIRSVAVYSDADRGAKHVAMADVAVRIGPASPEHSYLNIDAIVDAAKRVGAQAVHPGYGFLSENVAFARALSAADIVFVGPGENALDVMGDKIRSKIHVSARGVPVTPGIAEPGLTDDRLIAAAPDIGFPILIKPSAGGGGKGMTAVSDPADLPDALVAARRVAASAFGDDTLFLERLVSEPRHIEVQVLADDFGTVVHLGERECSLQRRHQKIIEEAPSSLLDHATRARIGEAACEVARSVDYRGAGTVEFLVSASSPGEFFFMEMNTRLQVEHPVTELVTAIDLVEKQLRIAAGEPLGLTQSDISLTGHAVEARVYAEVASRGFLPATGTVLALAEPRGDGIRVDSALVEGLEVQPHYDPMLSKIIAWGADRDEAIARLDRALAETTVLGVHTNIEFLRQLLAADDVRSGHLDTGLIERLLPSMSFSTADDHALAAAALLVHGTPPLRQAQGTGPWHSRSGWRVGTRRPTRYSFATSATDHVDVLVSGSRDAATVAIDGREATAASLDGSTIHLGGEARTVHLARSGTSIWVGHGGSAIELTLRDRATQLREHRASITRTIGAADPDVRAPMPGTVVAVNVETGDSVDVGDTLLTVEAMKMEHKMLAAIAGIVALSVTPGDLVRLDQVVATITPHEGIEEGAKP